MQTPAQIIIVEDDPMNMELASDLLEVGGYRVLKASTAEDGLALIRAERPDLILMDIALPGMDGLEAMRRLHADPQVTGIPIIAFTASIMEADREKIRAAGCQGIITKPIDTRNFVRTIAGYLAAGRKPPENVMT